MARKLNSQEINLLTEIVRNKNFIFDALVDTKIVRKVSNTAGAIYLPKGFVGRKFRVVLIPAEDEVLI